jgi:predicted amidohydrolase/RimJ/RimL family protein N-acetyltransferase
MVGPPGEGGGAVVGWRVLTATCHVDTERLRAAVWNQSELYDVAYGSLAEVVAEILTERTTRALPPPWYGDYDVLRAETWIAEREGDGTTLLVVTKEDSRPVGLLLLFETHGEGGRAEVRIGYVLAESAWGRGLASELVGGLVEWGRTQRSVGAIVGGVEAENMASIRVLEKCGFQLESPVVGNAQRIMRLEFPAGSPAPEKRSTLAVGVVQMRTDRGREANLLRARALVDRAVEGGAELVLLPEFFACGYTYELEGRELAEPLEGPSTQLLRDLAAEREIWLGGCVYERDGDGCFDTFVLAGPGGELHTHRKRSPSSFEHFFFEPGDDPVVVDTALGRVALVICYESMLPEVLAEAVHARPDLVLVGYSSPGTSPLLTRILGGPPVDMLRHLGARWARTTGAPTAVACVTGTWRSRLPYLPLLRFTLPFHGQSAIYDAAGTPIAALDDDEGVAVSTVHLAPPAPSLAVPTGEWVEPIPWLVGKLLKLPAVLGRPSYARWRRRRRSARL